MQKDKTLSSNAVEQFTVDSVGAHIFSLNLIIIRKDL